ncbi:MAG: phospholipase D-like domain-containing protein [Gemmataceae bacterium]|nr:phospholipase D-like domain-containing protein [Gemmataceae bacterium]
MPTRSSKTGSELFIVDNSEKEWKGLRYLHDWCQISKAIDIATGYFEIGALLGLDGEWQKVDQIRILMGNEVSFRTRAAFEKGLRDINAHLDASLEQEKEKNDFLAGVPAIVDAIRSGKIKCRVYRKEKFHAKAYITHARLEVVGSFALVGSSNFTLPGLTENIELNVQIPGPPVTVLQEWYEQHWDAAEDVTPEILRTIERHVREYTPFEVYAKALHEYFQGDRLEPDHWEATRSKMYPVLDQYQKDGYHNLVEIAKKYNGAFLCDGVGLGKTFIGLMLIERLILHERRNVLLLVPKGAWESVWKPGLRRYLSHLGRGAFSGLEVLTHTDLLRGGEIAERFELAQQRAHALVIDEAHHFRNIGTRGILSEDVNDSAVPANLIRGRGKVKPSRYRRLFDVISDKRVFMLTATPINNELDDLRHMIELFSRRTEDYFKLTVGIHHLRAHFNALNKRLDAIAASRGLGSTEVETDTEQAREVLVHDALFNSLVVQRSRAYVKESQRIHGGRQTMFPEREPPRVADYELRSTYGKLLDMVAAAFDKKKPLFSLAPYSPLEYLHEKPENREVKFDINRQNQVVALIRTGFLKRFESSVCAFQASCGRLLVKLLAFVVKHAKTSSERKALEAWKGRHKKILGDVQVRHPELFTDPNAPPTLFQDLEDDEDQLLATNVLDDVEELPRDVYDVPGMIAETMEDLAQLGDFLKELDKFTPKHDDKLKRLMKLLQTDPVLCAHKVMIFTEFADTAEYLREQLMAAEITGVEAVDGSSAGSERVDIIKRFAPYYNTPGGEAPALPEPEIRVLISTDVLSEGLNLQDATRLINYDLHWNPVRLMQRIGRVDRRLDPVIEARIVADHPERKEARGTIVYWNFLPPDELNTLLSLYNRVTHKTLRISRTFGIEGRKLLRPDDEFEALREFNAAYEHKSKIEEIKLEYDRLLKEDPGLAQRLDGFPGRVFSGKAHPQPGARAIFFCYALPAYTGTSATGTNPPSSTAAQLGFFDGQIGNEADSTSAQWSTEAGPAHWYLYDLHTNAIVEDPSVIVDFIRSTRDTPRRCTLAKETLAEIRAKIERHIKNTYLKSVQAPAGVKPALKAWMELT